MKEGRLVSRKQSRERSSARGKEREANDTQERASGYMHSLPQPYVNCESGLTPEFSLWTAYSHLHVPRRITATDVAWQ